MYRQKQSLAELGALSKRHTEEFGDISKDRAQIRALRAAGRAGGAHIPYGRLDRLSASERIAGKLRIATAPVQDLANTAERTTANVRGTAENVRGTAASTQQAVRDTDYAMQSAGRMSRNIGYGVGGAGLGTGAGLGGYALFDSKRKGGNVERDSKGRLRLKPKGREGVHKRGGELTRQEKKDQKTLARRKSQFEGMEHHRSEANYRPGMNFSPFTHTEVRRDSKARRALRPTAGYLFGGFAGKGLDVAARAASKGKYKTRFGSRIKGKYGRWGGRLGGASAGFTQNVRSGDVQPFRRSTGEQPKYKVVVPGPLGSRTVLYAGSKPAPKE